jgi:alanyl-tRNA synthetase
MFSAERDSAPELVAKALQESKALKRRQRELIELATITEAARLLAAADYSLPFKLVEAVFDGRDVEEVRLLASKIVNTEPSIALLGTRDMTAARIIFARSASLEPDMSKLLAEACQALGGRGGGKPDLAQGGGPQTGMLEEAIKRAAEKVMAGIGKEK